MTKDNYFDRKKTGYLNPLRVYACIAIILFHIFSIIVSSFGTSITENEKYISLLVRNICLWRVPAFVMISGVLFLNKEKEISIKKLWLKYISRIVLALLLFGIPFAFMEIYYDAHYKFNIGQIGSAVLNVFQGNLWDHMWYLYMLTGLYILLPLFKIFIYYADRKTLEYVLSILFIFTSLIPAFTDIFSFKFGFYIPISSVFVFYLLLGHYIHQYNLRVNNKSLLFLVLLYVLYVVLMALNKEFVNSNGSIIGLTFSSPLVVMAVLCVFCFFRQYVSTNKVYEFISPLTFGMYLIHPLLINLFIKFIKFTPEKYPFTVVVLVIFLVTIMFSFFFTIVARKIKILSKYIL